MRNLSWFGAAVLATAVAGCSKGATETGFGPGWIAIPSVTTIDVGTTARFQADWASNTKTPAFQGTWSSSDTTVARIDSTQSENAVVFVRGKSPGTTVLTMRELISQTTSTAVVTVR
jgi:hypothetical protein